MRKPAVLTRALGAPLYRLPHIVRELHEAACAPFPVSRGAASTGEEEGEAAAEEEAPEGDASEEGGASADGATEDGEPEGREDEDEDEA